MCGVFGFVSRKGHRPNLDILKRVAAVTMRRGPHAWGLAWIDGKGRLKMYKQAGRIGDHLNLLSMAADARFLIGHCRWATMGDPENNLNNHPHPSDGGWIVHNGQIHDYAEAVRRHGLHPVTECDSEILGQFIEEADGTLLDRCVEAARSVQKAPLVLLGLWNRPARLVAVRQGNPLHIGTLAEGYYLASLAEGLPGDVECVPDEHAIEFTNRGVRHAAF
jgi:glucosamine 6-phosphate synthetase-like amidotransferase/phosphosugar isomerase protein